MVDSSCRVLLKIQWSTNHKRESFKRQDNNTFINEIYLEQLSGSGKISSKTSNTIFGYGKKTTLLRLLNT